MQLIPMGTEIGGYVVGQQLGEGGMGAVYQAHKPGSKDRVAIKFLAAELIQDEDFRQRFEREIQAMETLKHPNIVPLAASGQEEGMIYFVMKLINGVSLDYLLERETFTPMDGWGLLDPIALAIDFAHQKQIIHRDIKPGNILIETVGDAANRRKKYYLTDFGLSKILGASNLTRTGMRVGTPHYMSPEQIMAKGLTAHSDVYSLGVVMYQMLTGRLPFDASDVNDLMLMHVRNEPPGPRSLHPDFPPALEAVLLRALAKTPESRYASAGQFLAAYVAAMQEDGQDSSRLSYWT
jgi:serine/threonine protein kinase